MVIKEYLLFSERLYLDAGNLTKVPKMCKCPKLSNIFLEYNPFTSIENEAFVQLTNTNLEVDLSNTRPYFWLESGRCIDTRVFVHELALLEV